MICPKCSAPARPNGCEECGWTPQTGLGSTKSWQPYTQHGEPAPAEWWLRKAIRRWCESRYEHAGRDHGKSIAELMLDEFDKDQGSPDHADYLRLEEFLERSAERLKQKQG